MMVKAADAAAGRMQSLERRIAEAAPGPEATAGSAPLADFREIRLQGVEYAYPAAPGERPFVLGPIDLTVRRGEVLFIVGGNGAGKSTLLRLLLGLYPPCRGQLLVDGREIGADDVSAYRELIAPVFSDFHLFQALYGIQTVDDREPAELLKWMEMDGATSVRGGRFERTDLSAGQRKRLALIAALLEHRPILALDEWAADQDPGFRRKFYREVIPALKARGLTVVAITHDDRYFDVADRHLRLEEGMLGEPAPESAP
jgi:putative ATP-binding cassette transporter